MNFSKSQQLMIRDGLPPAALMTQSQRDAAWEANPPRPVARFIDPQTKEQRELHEALKRQAAEIRIAKLKAGLERKKLKVDVRGKRWDPRKCKWVPDNEKRSQSQDDQMPKNQIIPYDADDRIVTRAKTSIPDDATPEQILAKMGFAFKRGGADRVVKITLTDPPGNNVLQTWLAADGPPLPEPSIEDYSDHAESQKPKEETDMASTARKTRAPKAGKAKVAKKTTASKKAARSSARTPTEKKPGVIASIVEFISRERGGSITEIVEHLAKKFPDREEKGMTATARIQANRNSTSKEKDDKRGLVYYKRR